MKLYVFYFSRVTKEVVRDEVEVEDKSYIIALQCYYNVQIKG